ncbi:MAG TPA: hypothetical protein DEA08_22795, partial [Planctomycetes bacterium]|nr:hypothetical protein [Planctomycetota bacterium]
MPELASPLSGPTLRRGLLRAALVVGLSAALLVFTYTQSGVWRFVDLGWAASLFAGHLAAGGRIVALSCVERWLALRPERAGPKVWGLIFLATWASAWLASAWSTYLRWIATTRSIPTALAQTLDGILAYPLVNLVSALWGLSLLALIALRLRGARLRHQIAVVATISVVAGAANMAAFGALSQVSVLPNVTQAAILVLGWHAGDRL